MHFNKFNKFIHERKCQFAKGNVFKIFNEFFGCVRNVRNDEKGRIILGFLQVAMFVIDPEV